MTLHYIGWYIDENNDEVYSGNVPGKLKMRYVAKKINEAGHHIQIFSLADKNGKGFYKRKKVALQTGGTLVYSGGISSHNSLLKKINTIVKKIQFIKYIIFCCKKDDVVIMYHSVSYTKTLGSLKRIVKRRCYLEVEEVYGYSAVEDKKWVNDEIKSIEKMDGYIFVNEGIPKEINIGNKPYVVSYGVSEIPGRISERFNDGKIHILYAGTIEGKKLGAYTAVETAKYLPNKYVLHILGFGKPESIEKLNEKIASVTVNRNSASVIYEGYKTGEELTAFLQKCHIGLSSNVMRPNFANNTFPSKVITYMCNGLSVVLGYAKAFYDVEVSKNWTFYFEHTPQAIAEAILKAPVVPVDAYYEEIKDMDQELVNFLKEVK